MSAIASGAPQQIPLPEIEEYLEEGMTRQRFIERGRNYLSDLRRWLVENNARERGRQMLQRFTRGHDTLLAAAYDHVMNAWQSEHGTETPPRLAVVALGGYGRRELFLGSDIDVLLLMESHGGPIEELVKSLMQLLVDLRLNLGHSTRTVEDCEERLGKDLESTTAMLECRPITGNRQLYQKLAERIRELISGRWRKWFLRAINAEWQLRREKFESTVYLLEPNLKESAGGLRDVHTVQWALFALAGSTELRHLKEHARFEEDDLRRFRESVGLIQTVRNQLHIVSNGKDDQLVSMHQPAVAAGLGYEPQEHRTAEEVFMHDYYRRALEVSRYARRAIRTIMESERALIDGLVKTLKRRRIDKHLVAQNDAIFIDPDDPDYFEEDHGRIMALFERAWRWGYRLSDRTLDHLSRVSRQLGPAFRLDPTNQERFMRILKGPQNVAKTISDMHVSEILDRFLPEFAHIRCMVRIDHYHHYTVDEHSIRALEMAERLIAEPKNKRGFPSKVAHQIKRWDLLNLALLLHDVGKGYGRGHALRGGQIAARIGDRMHLPPADIELVRFLILSHLKLTHAATRRDLEDPKVASQLAEEIGSLDRLKMLYVHSVCDLQAVRPDAYNDWKDRLLMDCYRRTAEELGERNSNVLRPMPNLERLTLSVLDELMDGAEKAAAKKKREELAGRVEDFLKNASLRYVQGVTPSYMARHFRLRGMLDEENLIAWQLLPDAGAGFSELLVCAVDVPGLFRKICGALAAKGINIWSAQIFSTDDGYAMNTFQVTDNENRPLPAELRLERLRHDLNLVIQEKKSLEEMIEKHKVRARTKPRRSSPLGASVGFDNHSSQSSTIIEVRSADRPGLLYTITTALQECQLNIQRALITTEAYGVVDVFYVTDLEYNKISNETTCKQIREKILEAISA